MRSAALVLVLLLASAAPADVRGEVRGGIRGEHPVYRERHGAPEPMRKPAVPSRVVSKVDPLFTPEAVKARVGGIVILELTVEADGRVSGGRVLKPLPFGLTKMAIECVRQWKFEPALHRGQPVRSTLNVSVSFRPPLRSTPGIYVLP